jgi:membrane protease YdiL (CAAX protease family)
LDVAGPGPGLIVLVALAVLGLAVTGWVLWPAFRGPEAARAALGTHRLAIGSIVSVVVLSTIMTVPFASVLRLGEAFTTSSFAVVALSTQIPMLLILYVRLIMPRAVSWADLGLKPLAPDYVLRMGLGGGLVALVATMLLSAVLDQIGWRPNQIEQYSFVLAEGPFAFALLLLFGAVSAPIIEELFFRGFIFGMYKRRQPRWVAYLGSSILFTLLHVQPGRMNLAQTAGLIVGILMLALLLAWLYDRTGSLYPSMLAHAVNNATGLILYYFVEGFR